MNSGLGALKSSITGAVARFHAGEGGLLALQVGDEDALGPGGTGVVHRGQSCGRRRPRHRGRRKRRRQTKTRRRVAL